MRRDLEPTSAALAADRELCAIQESYEFLSLLQPTNVDAAWERFEATGFDHEPEFEYPALEIDTGGLRRRLDTLALEGVEDPSLLYVLSAKRHELNLQLTLLERRNSPAFLAASIELFGPVDQTDIDSAEDVLASLEPATSGELDGVLDADEIRSMAEEELDYYRSRDSSFSCRLEDRSDQDGFMASEGNLLFPAAVRLPRGRAVALMQHEIGVHLVTYHNGCKQPLRLLRSGLSSYDELQEAFGALAEHCAGGLTPARMRTLAARVLAARMTEQQMHFVDVFRQLTREHGFTESGAFRLAARVHQAGGFTRDQIYLRGLSYLLRYLAAGGELEPLYLGKLGHAEIPMIQNLRRTGLLREPPVIPRFLEMEAADERVQRLRDGMTLVDLVEEQPPR